MAEACRTFNISRKTGYKWLKRYEKDGDSGLADQSRKPVNQPTKLSEKVLLRIVSIRVSHKHWGADKIRAILKREHCSPLPGRTTIHRVLRQAGLINLRRKRVPRLDNLRLVQDGGAALQVNDEWTIDELKQFRSNAINEIYDHIMKISGVDTTERDVKECPEDK